MTSSKGMVRILPCHRPNKLLVVIIIDYMILEETKAIMKNKGSKSQAGKLGECSAR